VPISFLVEKIRRPRQRRESDVLKHVAYRAE
jgi:hypothetical protein